MPRFPDNIIKRQEQDAQYKWDDCYVFISITSKQRDGIKMKKFTDHPVTVCSDPHRNSKIMTKFTHVLPGTPGNNDRNDKGREDHGNPEWPPYHAPANILKKPEYYVQVFHLSVTKWNIISLFC